MTSLDDSDQPRGAELSGGPQAASRALNGQEGTKQSICQTDRRTLITKDCGKWPVQPDKNTTAMSPFNYRRRANRKHPVFCYWCFVLRGTISEASTFLLIYGIRAKTHVCTQVRDRRTASQPFTVIGAGSGTDSDLHPQCDFQSYTHAHDNAAATGSMRSLSFRDKTKT